MRVSDPAMPMNLRSAVVTVALALGAATVEAQPVDHAALGAQYAADGKYDDALRELELAYRETATPQLLYAMGRVHALRGDCVRALDHFRRFLATAPGPRSTEAANAEIARCAPPPPDPTDGDAGVGPPPDPPPPDPPPPPAARPGFASALAHDRFAQIGLVAGVVAAGAGGYALYLSCWDGVCEGS